GYRKSGGGGGGGCCGRGGGCYGYPHDAKSKNGKLRLLYECAPMSFIVEQAGGKGSDGHPSVLDIQPTESNGDGEQDNKTKAEELQTQSGIFTTLFSGEVTEAGESFIFSSLFSVLSSPARWRRRKFQLCKSLLRRGG
ncbi:unnamed protein product, partial [Brassica oleracea var. botrytis]